MDKEVVVLLLSPKNEYNNAICSVDTPGDYHTKWNHTEKNKYVIKLYVESKKYDTYELIYKAERDSEI